MSERSVGVIGATGMVGDWLLPRLVRSGCKVVAFSRQAVDRHDAGIEWRVLAARGNEAGIISDWIVVAPVWVLPEHFALLEACGARRVIVLSSTSRFVKGDSADVGEQRVAAQLAAGETALQQWAVRQGVAWVILRPTLVYGGGRDQNITAVARFIRRFGFFPLVGDGRGLRQPIHADDVAAACVAALAARGVVNRDYNISGGETLSYREMVARVFAALQRPVRWVSLPRGLVGLAIFCLRVLPGFRHANAAMAERMNRDLVFDHADAVRDFGFSPRPFAPAPTDVSP